jgi:hypothetical protein
VILPDVTVLVRGALLPIVWAFIEPAPLYSSPAKYTLIPLAGAIENVIVTVVGTPVVI